jgi:hypothetical protein
VAVLKGIDKKLAAAETDCHKLRNIRGARLQQIGCGNRNHAGIELGRA